MIDNYPDININLRHWIPRILSELQERRSRVVYYDIGSNDGELSLPFLDRIDRLVAFEPGPAGVGFDERVPEDRRGDVVRFPVALGAARGTAELSIYNDDTFSSLYRRPEMDLQQYRLSEVAVKRVEVWPLDELIQERKLPQPDFIKMDIEGAELFALRGMGNIMEAAQPALLIEYSCINTRNAGYERRLILEVLRSWGYDPKGLFRAEDLTLHSNLDPCSIWNLLCLPAGID